MEEVDSVSGSEVEDVNSASGSEVEEVDWDSGSEVRDAPRLASDVAASIW